MILWFSALLLFFFLLPQAEKCNFSFNDYSKRKLEETSDVHCCVKPQLPGYLSK